MQSIAQLTTEIKAQFGHVLNGRIERGHALAMAGAVSQVDGHTWNVKSATEAGKVYTIKFEMVWSCDCEDFAGTGHHPAAAVDFGGSVQPTCKHILASAMCYFAGEYPAPPAFDLVICTKKLPFVSAPDGKILWFKLAGQEKVEPTKTAHLTDGPIQAKLARYELVGTEARQSQVIRRYRLATCPTCKGRGQYTGVNQETNHVGPIRCHCSGGAA